MRYATVDYDRQKPCIITEDGNHAVLLSDLFGDRFPTLNSFIEKGNPSDVSVLQKASEANEGLDLASLKLLAPIPSAKHDILCVGVNYVSHLEETKSHFFAGKFETPQSTVYFGKRARVIVGPDAPIPGHFELKPLLDYEVELAVVIGKEIDSSVGYEDLPSYVFGYSVFNDISARKLQGSHAQWYYGKSLDGYSVMGPWIVSADSVNLEAGLDLSSKVNGELRQSSNTKLLRMNVWDLIYELSRGIVLEPGDIIATGTPSGVGGGFTPPRYLNPGDVVEMEVQGIGVLRNRIE